VCSIITATNGTADCLWSAAQLNTNGGPFFYEAGVISNGDITVQSQGSLYIKPSVFATGTPGIPWRTSVVYSAYNWIGTPWIDSVSVITASEWAVSISSNHLLITVDGDLITDTGFTNVTASYPATASFTGRHLYVGTTTTGWYTKAEADVAFGSPTSSYTKTQSDAMYATTQQVAAAQAWSVTNASAITSEVMRAKAAEILLVSNSTYLANRATDTNATAMETLARIAGDLTKLGTSTWASADSTTNYVLATTGLTNLLTLSGGGTVAGNVKVGANLIGGGSSLTKTTSDIILTNGIIIGGALGSGATYRNVVSLFGAAVRGGSEDVFAMLGATIGASMPNVAATNTIAAGSGASTTNSNYLLFSFANGYEFRGGPIIGNSSGLTNANASTLFGGTNLVPLEFINLGFADLTGTYDQNASLSGKVATIDADIAGNGLLGTNNQTAIIAAGVSITNNAAAIIYAGGQITNNQIVASNAVLYGQQAQVLGTQAMNQANAVNLASGTNGPVWTTLSCINASTMLTGSVNRVRGPTYPFAWTLTNTIWNTDGGTATVELLDVIATNGTFTTITTFNVNSIYTSAPLSHVLSVGRRLDYRFLGGLSSTNIDGNTWGVR
jgi:hypothetical protein